MFAVDSFSGHLYRDDHWGLVTACGAKMRRSPLPAPLSCWPGCCAECIAVACLAIAVPAADQPAAVAAGAFCAICLAAGVPLWRARAADGGHLECATCRDEHPRSGRYAFGGGDRDGLAVVSGGRDGNGNRRRGML